MKGVRHYTKEGKTWKGGMHKMKNGDLHSGKTHTKSSQKLYHFGELSKKAKAEFNEEIVQERIDYQKNYCVQQMKNEKTSMVLLKYFDEKWVNNYIKTVLFDF